MVELLRKYSNFEPPVDLSELWRELTAEESEASGEV